LFCFLFLFTYACIPFNALSTHTTVQLCFSLHTAFALIFIYWPSPLIVNELLIPERVICASRTHEQEKEGEKKNAKYGDAERENEKQVEERETGRGRWTGSFAPMMLFITCSTRFRFRAHATQLLADAQRGCVL
jgi:hypothetical protein